jgi:hypothetical protein
MVQEERRYSLASGEARALLCAAEEHLSLDVYDALRPVAYSQTTYYDRVDDSFFHGSENQVNRRVRVRQYAAAKDPDSQPIFIGPAYLEFKESMGVHRRKLRHACDPEELADLLSGASLGSLAKDLEASPDLYDIAMAIRRSELAPVFSTWYRRLSMSGQQLRLTIDENVAFCTSIPPLRAGDPVSQLAPFDLISTRILEVKNEHAIPDWLKSMLGSLRSAEIPSKFHRGMATLRSPKRRSLSATLPLRVYAAHRIRSS